MNAPTSYSVGDRVTVAIPASKRDGWGYGAVDALQGAAGQVSDVRPTKVLITFDKPVAPWWSNGSEHTAFWFDADELAPIGGGS